MQAKWEQEELRHDADDPPDRENGSRGGQETRDTMKNGIGLGVSLDKVGDSLFFR
jgi:hypothetical protein